MAVSALNAAMKLLGVRPHSEFELFQKLKKKSYPINEINQALVDCVRYGFLNDQLYAKDYASILSSRGYGAYVIKQKLRLIRINEEYINEALNQLEFSDEDAERAFSFKMRMLKNEKDPRKKREKLYRFMLGRGFSSDIIKSLLEKSLNQ